MIQVYVSWPGMLTIHFLFEFVSFFKLSVSSYVKFSYVSSLFLALRSKRVYQFTFEKSCVKSCCFSDSFSTVINTKFVSLWYCTCWLQIPPTYNFPVNMLSFVNASAILLGNLLVYSRLNWTKCYPKKVRS